MKFPLLSREIEKSVAKNQETTAASRVVSSLPFLNHFTHGFPIYGSSNVAQRGELASFSVHHKHCHPGNYP